MDHSTDFADLSMGTCVRVAADCVYQGDVGWVSRLYDPYADSVGVTLASGKNLNFFYRSSLEIVTCK